MGDAVTLTLLHTHIVWYSMLYLIHANSCRSNTDITQWLPVFAGMLLILFNSALGWGSLKLRSLIHLLWKYSILQKYLLDSLTNIYTYPVPTQLNCSDTCKIWTWYSKGKGYFDCSEKKKEIAKLIPGPWWRHQMEAFPHYWPFVKGIHRSPADSPHKGQWRGVLMFSLICAEINGWGWANSREAGDLRRHRAHYNVTVVIRQGAWQLLIKFSKLDIIYIYETNYHYIDN